MHVTDAVLPVPAVLATKIAAPRPRQHLVRRQRLWQRLDSAVNGPVTLITAPAGFGKTTLLSAWQAQRKQTVCWLALDERDNDLPRFWRYFVAALRQQQPDIGTPLLAELSGAAYQIETLLTALVNEIAATDAEIVLVLDDYHLITLDAIHASLAFFIAHQPATMHLIIASRSTPPLPLTRLRARAALVEIQSSDLCFTRDETRRFLCDTMALQLTDGQITTLATQTEGWIAGLHLAALSLQETPDPAALITAFAGNHRYIFDYLAEEVLRHQPEAIQRFLMQTAILERLNAHLCAAVTEQPASSHILATLEQVNLFIVALDEERCWYRYHALFRDFLRAQLQQHTPEEIPILHARASHWHEQQGDMAAAIEHALAGADFSRAAMLIERVDETLFKRGEAMTLLRWLAALPETIIADHPQLGFFYAGALTTIGRLDMAEQRLQGIEARIAQLAAQPNPDVAALRLWRSEISAARTIIAAYRGDIPRMLNQRQQALADLPADNPFIQSILAAGKAAGYYWSGDVSAADRELDEMLLVSRNAGNIYIEVASLGLRGFVRMMQGRLREGAAVFQQAIAMSATDAGQVTPILALAYIGLGELAYEWNDLPAAIHYLEQGLAIGEAWGDLRSLSYGYMMLARVTYFHTSATSAFSMMDAIERRARQQHIDDVLGWAAASRVWLLVAHGDLAAAAHWMQIAERDQNIKLGLPYQCMRIAQVRWHIANGTATDALRIIDEILPEAVTSGAERSIVEMTMLRALAQQARGDVTAALATFAAALAMAAPEGYLRLFADAGPRVHALLAQLAQLPDVAATHGVTADYIASLLMVAGCHPAPTTVTPALNDREMAILRSLAAGKSNAAIAQELIVAATTVKWHIKHLYRKLGVHSRTQAIARAHALGLLH